jgi:hypothetical protein
MMVQGELFARTERLVVRLTRPEALRLKKAALRQHRPVSQLVREAIAFALRSEPVLRRAPRGPEE